MNNPWDDKEKVNQDEIEPVKKTRKKKVESKDDGTVLWNEIEFKKIDTNEFAIRMKNAGIITYQDVLSNRNTIFSILQNLYGIDVAMIRDHARKYKKE